MVGGAHVNTREAGMFEPTVQHDVRVQASGGQSIAANVPPTWKAMPSGPGTIANGLPKFGQTHTGSTDRTPGGACVGDQLRRLPVNVHP